MDWATFWDPLRDALAKALDFILDPFLHYLNGIQAILDFINAWLVKLNEKLSGILQSFDSSWLNPTIQQFPSGLTECYNFCNGFFPLEEFISLSVDALQLSIACVLLRLVVRSVTLGQA